MFQVEWKQCAKHRGGEPTAHAKDGFATYDEAEAFHHKTNNEKGRLPFNFAIRCTKATALLIGMGATVHGYSDSHPYTVFAVGKGGKSISVRPDKAIRTDSNGMSDSQSYSYEVQPEAALRVYTLRKNGSWIKQGEPAKGGERIAIGYRHKYHDYSF